MFSFSSDTYSAPPFWQNGPAPGSFYNFPSARGTNCNGKQHSKAPVVTATSIVAFRFDKGVIVAGDTLGSYGSLARYSNCPRILKVNDNILLGAGGDYGDFQYVKDLIEQKIIDEECLDDGYSLKPKSLYCWLTRIMYNRRSKFDPFWNNFVVAGIEDGVPFLGTVDKLGTAYQDKAICSGFGAHLALPLVREALDNNPNPSEQDARDLVAKAMEVLFYRDARSYSKYQVGIVTADGIEINDNIKVNQKWDLAYLIQ